MKPAALLITFLPLMAFCQYDEELGYMPPAYPVDSSRPILHTTTLSFALTYSDRHLREGADFSSRVSDVWSNTERYTIHSLYSQGFRLGYNYSSGRLYFTMGVGTQFFRFSQTSEYDNWNRKDTVQTTSHSITDIRGKIMLVNLTSGFGIQLLRPDSKFNITPLLLASPLFAFRDRSPNEVIHTISDYRLVSATRDSSSHADTTYTPRFRGAGAMFDLMGGVILSYRLSSEFSVQAQYMTGISPAALFNGRDKLGNYISASFCYQLNEKTSYKRQKRKRIPNVEPDPEEEVE